MKRMFPALRGRFVIVIILATLHAVAHASYAAAITEVLSAPAQTRSGIVPAYIELDLHDITRPVDLIILDANPWQYTQRIKQVFTITPGARDSVVLSAGQWSTSRSFGADIRDVAPAFAFTSPNLPTTRRLLLVDHVTNWTPNTAAPPIDQWSGVLDVVTITFNGGFVPERLPGEPLVQLAAGEALYRSNQIGGTSHYIIGPVDDQLTIFNTVALTPGFRNEALPLIVPAPVTAVALAVLWGLSVARLRGGSSLPEGRPATHPSTATDESVCR